MLFNVTRIIKADNLNLVNLARCYFIKGVSYYYSKLIKKAYTGGGGGGKRVQFNLSLILKCWNQSSKHNKHD